MFFHLLLSRSWIIYLIYEPRKDSSSNIQTTHSSHPDCNQEKHFQVVNEAPHEIHYLPIHGTPCHMISLKQESWDMDDWGRSESAHKVHMTWWWTVVLQWHDMTSALSQPAAGCNFKFTMETREWYQSAHLNLGKKANEHIL